MRESRMPGSARGARSNPRPYRDRCVEACETLPMGGVKVACTIAGVALDWNDLILHFRAKVTCEQTREGRYR